MAPRQLPQRLGTAILVRVFPAVERVPGIPEYFARSAHVPEPLSSRY